MRGLSDRVFAVTGAASGIGKATTERLVEAGALVAMIDRDEEGLRTLGDSLAHDRATIFAADVAVATAVEDAVDSIVERFGQLHGVVTSAGIFDPADLVTLEDLDLAVFDSVLSVNLRGTVLALRAALPRLSAGAAIVTVASTAGLRGHGLGAAYTASKGAVVALTRLLAIQYGPKGIRVNCVCPGATAGEGMGAAFDDPDLSRRIAGDVPLRRVGRAAELGATIATLLSDETSYLTGQVVAVDGGATAR